MKRFQKIIAVLLSTLYIISTVSTAAGLGTLYQMQTEQIISKGVMQYEKVLLTPDGFITYNVITADMDQPYLAMRTLSSDNGTQTLVNTQILVAQNNGIAGINADFFAWENSSARKGSPIGVIIRDSELITTSSNDEKMASFMQLMDGTLSAAYLPSMVTVTVDKNKETMRIKNMNKYDDLTGVCLYDRNWGTSYISRYEGICKIVVENNIVTFVTGAKEDVAIPENGYVLACLANWEDFNFVAENIEIGDKLTLRKGTDPELDEILSAVGGGTFLVKNGKSAPITHGETGRHPRTAIGTDKTGTKLYMITVDGRQKSSIGVTLPELTEIMLNEGVYNGINLDGGGSTTMVSRVLGDSEVRVVNSPSDSSLRPVASVVGLMKNAPLGGVKWLDVKTQSSSVFSGTSSILTVTGYDEYYNKVAINQNNVKFSVSGVKGTFDGENFKPTSAGKATITASYGNATGSAEIDVLGEVASLSIGAKTLDMSSYNSLPISLVGKDGDGYSAPINLWDAKITAPKFTKIEYNTLKKTSSGAGVLTISVGNASVNAAVITDSNMSKPELPSDKFVADKQKTSANLEKNGFRFAVFGSAPNPSNLLENLTLVNAMNAINKTCDFAAFVGDSNQGALGVLTVDSMATGEFYNIALKDNSAFIQLSNKNGGLRATNAQQWSWLANVCDTTDKKNIFIFMPKDLNSEGFADQRELDAFYDLLEKKLVNKGKNVYVFTNNEITNVKRHNGIRCITTGGVPKNLTTQNILGYLPQLQYVEVTVNGDNVTYQFKNIFETASVAQSTDKASDTKPTEQPLLPSPN